MCVTHTSPWHTLLSAVEHAILRFQMVADNSGHPHRAIFVSRRLLKIVDSSNVLYKAIIRRLVVVFEKKIVLDKIHII